MDQIHYVTRRTTKTVKAMYDELIITAQELKHSLQLGAPIARSARHRFGSNNFATCVG
jgi:hypothetical protein